jgi:hypothetical protein
MRVRVNGRGEVRAAGVDTVPARALIGWVAGIAWSPGSAQIATSEPAAEPPQRIMMSPEMSVCPSDENLPQ